MQVQKWKASEIVWLYILLQVNRLRSLLFTKLSILFTFKDDTQASKLMHFYSWDGLGTATGFAV